MLARALAGILPPLSRRERLEVTRIHSAAGLLGGACRGIVQRPVRSPHHTVSRAGLVGGGPFPRPGEISLAHRGVLFLDELPEFPRSVTEVLRQPIEDGRIVLSRAAGSLAFPCRFQVVAAMNPCPCGWFGSRKHSCRCSPGMVRSYRDRLSGPLLDRIDLRVEMPEVSYAELAGTGGGETSAAARQRVIEARRRQEARNPGAVANAALTLADLRTVAPLPAAAARLLEAAVTKLGLSPRAYVRIIRVARSCADLDGGAPVGEAHVAEALQFRTMPARDPA
jgi:magnesium chelatase family protein